MEKKGNIEHVTGLRGFAVVLLVLFYLNNQTWTQGYLGIDILFVVTGYLLFSSRRNFNGYETLRDGIYFVVRRLQKIIPPTAIVILGALIVGACMLWWEDEQFLSELGLDACMAKANILLSGKTRDFFYDEAMFVPLRHLWYISSLVQIYVLWCIGNQLLQKQSKQNIIVALSAVALCSLAYRYSYDLHEWLAKGGVRLWTQTDPISPFETFPRLWEALAGGIVTLLPSLKRHQFWATVATLVGALLILPAALVGVLPGTEGLSQLPCSLLVVVGTILAIRYTPTSHFPQLLTNKGLMWLGRISFSLYLVSVPVIVFGSIWLFGDLNFFTQVGLLALSLAVGWLLRHYVERKEISPEVTLGLWGTAFLLCGAGYLTEGFKDYVPSVTINIPEHQWHLCRDDRLRRDWNPSLNLSTDVFKLICSRMPKTNITPLLTLGDQNRRPSIVLIGDSHAAGHYAGLSNLCLSEDLGGVYVSTSFLPFHNWQHQNNVAKEQALLLWLKQHPELTTVVISQRWNAKRRDVAKLSGLPWAKADRFETDLRAFLTELRNINKQVIIIAPGPEFDMKPLQHYCKALALRGMKLMDIAPSCSLEAHKQRNQAVFTVLDKMVREGLCSILDPQEAVDPKTGFLSAAENTLLMFDRHNMYGEHSAYLMERLKPQMRELLGISAEQENKPNDTRTKR